MTIVLKTWKIQRQTTDEKGNPVVEDIGEQRYTVEKAVIQKLLAIDPATFDPSKSLDEQTVTAVPTTKLAKIARLKKHGYTDADIAEIMKKVTL